MDCECKHVTLLPRALEYLDFIDGLDSSHVQINSVEKSLGGDLLAYVLVVQHAIHHIATRKVLQAVVNGIVMWSIARMVREIHVYLNTAQRAREYVIEPTRTSLHDFRVSSSWRVH